MNTESPLNHPTSRDPRLTHLRPPIRTSLSRLPAPQLPNSPVLPQTATQDDAGCGDFIRGISGLVRATIQDTQNQAEKERLQKQKESTERLLKRARFHPNFPATIEYYQRARDDEDAEISRIDKALEDSTRHQLEKELKAKLPSSTADGKIHELENEIQAIKNESAQLMERNQSLEKTLNAKLCKMDATHQSHLITQAKHNRDSKERMDHYQALSSSSETKFANITAEMDNFKQKAMALEAASAPITAEMNKLKQKAAAIDTRIDQLLESQNDCTHSVAKTVEKTKEQQEKLDGIKLQVDGIKLQDVVEPIRKGMYEIRTRLLSYESSHGSAGRQEQHIPHAELQNLASRVQTLEGAPNLMPQVQLVHDGLKALTEIRRKGDDLHFEELDKIKQRVKDQADKSADMSNEIARLANGLQSLSQLNPTAQQVATVAGFVQHAQKTLESLTVGLHSLETRYNNLSTETVVKNMVVAMQEMYPNISQLTDQTSKLKGLIDKELPPLLARIDRIDRKLQSHIDTTRQDAIARMEQLNRLKDDHSTLSQSLGPLWERFGSEDQQLVGSEEFRTLQADLSSLVNKINEYPVKDEILTFGDVEVLKSQFNVLDQRMGAFRTSFNEQLGAKADDDRIRQTVNKERDFLMKQIGSISATIAELHKNIKDLKAADTKQYEKLISQEGDIDALRDHLKKLQESTLDKYQHLCKKLDDIIATTSSHASNASTPVTAQEGSTPLQKTKQESPAPEATRVEAAAESSPALVLQEQKKKKKRPRPSSQANEEKDSAPPSESPVSTPRPDETPELRKKRRKKKRKVEGPITIDD
ncbi:uncharacterized protein LDX57_009547 [Aspergillus melleus]|uniref:uncharacterized protein n=1 Tax=Aspergillus melleus TaxID=138277 RepID=UPI001E8D1B9F|nr:uncharacterized protein LDX57_009547 [Aspergillus melleus]KAH8431897.1 hypothetical protein LDX57_009547 [Aspergillus melleus]